MGMPGDGQLQYLMRSEWIPLRSITMKRLLGARLGRAGDEDILPLMRPKLHTEDFGGCRPFF